MLNDDGKSYAFDSRGSGYGRGEGVATIVLKRLDDAIRDSDPVRAIVRNTGINQDGRTSGITFPNQKSQETLIRSVYEAAGLDPQRTTYVEAHGTGTVAGMLSVSLKQSRSNNFSIYQATSLSYKQLQMFSVTMVIALNTFASVP